MKGTPALLTLLRLRSASLLYAQPAGAAMPAYAGRGCAYRSVSSSLRRRRRSRGESRGVSAWIGRGRRRGPDRPTREIRGLVRLAAYVVLVSHLT